MKKDLLVFVVLLFGLAGLLLTSCSEAFFETQDYIAQYTPGCQPTFEQQKAYAEQLKMIGLFGEHQLGRHKIDSELRGSVSGCFFFVGGSFSGEIGTADYLKFAWRTKEDRLIISLLPLNKIVVLVDETKETPTIRFKFKIRSLQYPDVQRTLRAEGANFNQNVFIDADYIAYATVRINPDDLEKEIYLPFSK